MRVPLRWWPRLGENPRRGQPQRRRGAILAPRCLKPRSGCTQHGVHSGGAQPAKSFGEFVEREEVWHESRLSPHASISTPSIVDAALTILDESGLPTVTIRSVASRVGVPPMTLYTHFKGKPALLDLMFAEVARRLYRDSGHDTWQAECAALCHHIRSVLLEHPRWIALMARPTRPPDIPLRERLIALMTRDGVLLESALVAIWNLILLTIGFVSTELSFRDSQGASAIAQQFELLRQDAAQPIFAERERLSHLAFKDAAPFDMGAHFSAAVATFIEGIAAQRVHPSSSGW